MASTDSLNWSQAALNYNSTSFGSLPEYRSWMVSLILEGFEIPDEYTKPNLLIADLGGGTGLFTQSLAEACHVEFLNVDACPEMLAQSAKPGLVRTLCMDAVEFAHSQTSNLPFRHFLIKDALHLIPWEQHTYLFEGLLSKLDPSGSIIILTRPNKSPFPFFALAHKQWSECHPPYEVYIDALRAAGFSVLVRISTFPMTLPKQQWFQLLASRFFSPLKKLTDLELETGLCELQTLYANDDSIAFEDCAIVLQAKRSRGISKVVDAEALCIKDVIQRKCPSFRLFSVMKLVAVPKRGTTVEPP